MASRRFRAPVTGLGRNELETFRRVQSALAGLEPVPEDATFVEVELSTDARAIEAPGLFVVTGIAVLPTGATRIAHGLQAPPEGFAGVVWIVNDSATENLQLPHESASTNFETRFILPSGATLTLTPGGSAALRYRHEVGAWYVVSQSFSTADLGALAPIAPGIAAPVVLGRETAGTGDVEALSVGFGLELNSGLRVIDGVFGELAEANVWAGANEFTERADFDAGIVVGDEGTEGNSINVNGTTFTADLKVSNLGGSQTAQLLLHRHSTTQAPILGAARSHSDTASHAIVQNGDILFALIGAGWDGIDYQTGAEMRFTVDGVPGSNDMPTRIGFFTTPNGSGTRLERLRIGEDGHVLISQSLEVDGQVDFDADVDFNSTSSFAGVATFNGTSVVLGSGTSLSANGNASFFGSVLQTDSATSAVFGGSLQVTGAFTAFGPVTLTGTSVTVDAGTPVTCGDNFTCNGTNATFNTSNVVFSSGTTAQANGILAVASSGSFSCSGTAFFNDATEFNDSVEFNGNVVLGGKVNYTSSSSVSNFDVDGVNFIRFDCGSPITVHGFANGVDGQRVTLMNGAGGGGANTVSLPYNSGTASAGNRILNRTTGTYVLSGRCVIDMVYDGTDGFWYLQVD